MDNESTDVGLTVEELNELLSKYFYTKEEQKENSSLNSDVSSSNVELVVSKLEVLDKDIQTTNSMLYLVGIGFLGVFLLFIYYRFLKQFIERWY